MRKASAGRVFFWARRGGLTVVDQALVSAATFLLNILLARWLPKESYGAFSLGFSILLFLSAIHTAMITEPLLVFGPVKYAGNIREYLGALAVFHAAVSVVITAAAAVAAIICRAADLAVVSSTLWGCAIAAPLYLLLQIARYASYALQRPGLAGRGSFLYLIIVALGSYFFHRNGMLSTSVALLVIGGAGLISGGAVFALLKPVWFSQAFPRVFRDALASHWRYGRWAVGTSLLNSSQGFIYSSIIAVYLGLETVAIIRALHNLVAPVYQFLTAMSFLFVPWSAKRLARKGTGILNRDALTISIGVTMLALLYWVTLVGFRVPIVNLVYGDRYGSYSHIIPILSLSILFTALASGVNVVMKAAGRSDLVFLFKVISSCIALPVTWLIVSQGSLTAAAASMNVFILTATIAAWSVWLIKGRKLS